MSERELELRALRRERPRSRFLRFSMLALAMLMAVSWLSGEFRLADTFSERRADNAARFLGEIVPYPLQGKPFEAAVAIDWASRLLADGGAQATLATLAIAVAAIVLAAAGAALLCLPAARNVMSPEAFVASPRAPTVAARGLATATITLVRAFMIFVRALPEYVWAFLLIKIFGFGAWPAVLALAIHNSGILGKLMAETVENMEPGTARALRGLGATRAQIATAAILPDVLPRFLLYFFYRWETCVREATVLGMLGVLSLGSLIRDARASNFYDEMIFYVLLGAVLVLIGDLLSAIARGLVRRAA